MSKPDADPGDLLFQGGGAGGTGAIVVGFDRHAAGRAALERGVRLAAGLGTRVVVVHVIDSEDAPLDPDAPGWEEQVDASVRAVRDAAVDVLEGAGMGWSFRARRGNPAVALAAVAAAEDAQMIVLGAPRTGLASAMERLLGEAVATRLLRHGHRPVLVVPEDPEPA